MRNKFAEEFYRLAKLDKRLCLIVADLSPAGAIDAFRKDFPERFINVGVAEQIMIGLSAGLALNGMRPFAYTIAPFSVYRPFEMVRLDLCYQNAPVTVVGMGSGVIYSTLGTTHHTNEDISVLSGVPNLKILAPCDPLEMIHAVNYCGVKSKSPTYLRIGKAGEKTFTESAEEPFEFGRIRFIRRGTDTAILAFGHVFDLAAEVADELSKSESISLISCHTIKPLDEDGIAKVLKKHRRVIVIEEHSCIGGLAQKVKVVAWDTKAVCDLRTFSLKDEFIHCYGTHKELRAAHGLSFDTILAGLK